MGFLRGMLSGAEQLRYVSVEEFRRRFRFLILLTWLLPPVVGVSFLLYIELFSVEQMFVIMTGPLVAPFIISAVFLALWYFTRLARPVCLYLGEEQPNAAQREAYFAAIRRFPLHYWSVFVLYLIGASTLVVISSGIYTDFVPSGADWFRVHLVGLIVSIIVGLPIFFRLLDLFGLTLKGTSPYRPIVSIRSKMLMLGALTPLLVDTLLVQYYWSRTGFFSFETFLVWFALELIAIGGSLMFVRSLGQSLAPLTNVIRLGEKTAQLPLDKLLPYSVDELGTLAGSYQQLIRNIQAHNAILSTGSQLNESEQGAGIGPAIDGLLRVSQEMLGGDKVIILLHEPESGELVAVARSGSTYSRSGYFRIKVNESFIPAVVFRQGQAMAIDDIRQQPGQQGYCRESDAISVIGAPLKVSGQGIGVILSVETSKSRHYSEGDLALIEQIANETAVAIRTNWLLEERLRAKQAAMDSEGRVRLLLDSTVEAIYGADTEGRCTFVNRALLEMLGYEHEDELLGKSIHEMIHHSYPDGSHYPKEECAVRQATMRGEPGHCAEEVHWRKDGTAVPVEYWSHPVYEGDQLVGTVVMFMDISERRRAEESMRQLHERNALLLESTGDGILGVDTELCCTFANQAASRLLGYSQQELVGSDMRAVLQQPDRSGHLLPAEDFPVFRAITDEQAQHADDEVLWRKDGRSIPVEYSANPILQDGRVSGAVMVFRDVTEARAIARKIDYLATHDSLTGLVNRREFEARLEQSLRQAREEGVSHVLCYLDLDQFKIVNDTCGHVAGDELLRQLGSLLHVKIRQSDMLARLGGDEFGVLLDGCPMAEALRIADELRMTVEDYRFAWEDKTFSVGVSIGMVAIDGETESISSAMSAADSACYAAKDRGRNCIHVYELNDDEMSRRRGEMQWVSRLQQALEADRFLLRYQPIVPVAGAVDDTTAIEILLALRDEKGEIVPPGAFIPAAERYNVMASIDRWVVSRVVGWLVEHREELDGLKRCYINLSGQSIGQESFLEFLLGQLRREGLDADKLCFEITETAAVANLSSAVRFIKVIKQFGCRFALDDFGSGMSSFAYLKNLPVDYLKIDGNFVRDMVNDPVDRAMVRAIHQVGHVMQIETIAEYVENDAILEALREIGVDRAQGYGIARPAPLETYLKQPARV